MGLRERVQEKVQAHQERRAEDKKIYHEEYQKALAEKRAEQSVSRDSRVRTRAQSRASFRVNPMKSTATQAGRVGGVIGKGWKGYQKSYTKRHGGQKDMFGSGGWGGGQYDMFGKPIKKKPRKKRSGTVTVNINLGKKTTRKKPQKKKDPFMELLR